MDSFTVAAPGWWRWLALASAVLFIVVAWRDADRRYQDAPTRRALMRTFVGFAAIAFVVLVFGTTLESVRVKGDRLDVRHSFQRSYEQRSVSDASYVDIVSRRARRGSQYNVLVLTFTDGTSVEIRDSYANYQKLRIYLENHGVTERPLQERVIPRR